MKQVAGDDGVCRLSTERLATLGSMGSGSVHRARAALLDKRLLAGRKVAILSSILQRQIGGKRTSGLPRITRRASKEYKSRTRPRVCIALLSVVLPVERLQVVQII